MTQQQTAPGTGSPQNPASTAFLDAISHGRPHHTPIWFMRQAGRALPEYRAIRGIGSILEAIANPDLVTEITLQPVRRYGVDAAVLFSDIVVPVLASGTEVDIVPGKGPVVPHPIRGLADLNNIDINRARDQLDHVRRAVSQLRQELGVPLLGFSGAPFTVASYLIEGGPSKNYEQTKIMMLTEPQLWNAVMERLVDLSFVFLEIQIEHGARAVQVFDSWVGALSIQQYVRYVKPHMTNLFNRLSGLGVPIIHFGVGTNALLEEMGDYAIDVMGLDWRTSITQAQRRMGSHLAFQGNLDPAVALTNSTTLIDEARSVLVDSQSVRRYIFNLGHGVLPSSNPELLTELVEFVHREGEGIRGNAAHS